MRLRNVKNAATIVENSNYVINDYEKIFYKEAIDNLLKSLKNETFINLTS